jgi:DNA-binding MarR family transcriptional regulator
MPLRQMADTLELERTSLYRAVAPLQREGFVCTHRDPDDGRVKQARIEKAGLDKIQEVLPVWREAQASFLRAVGDTEWEALSGRLIALREHMADDPDIRAQLRA